MKQKNPKKYLGLNIIPFESGTTNYHTNEQDNCHCQSMCYERPVRFKISLREIFSKSESAIVMKKYDESDLMHILQDLGLFNMLIVKRVSEMVFFK